MDLDMSKLEPLLGTMVNELGRRALISALKSARPTGVPQ